MKLRIPSLNIDVKCFPIDTTTTTGKAATIGCPPMTPTTPLTTMPTKAISRPISRWNFCSKIKMSFLQTFPWNFSRRDAEGVAAEEVEAVGVEEGEEVVVKAVAAMGGEVVEEAHRTVGVGEEEEGHYGIECAMVMKGTVSRLPLHYLQRWKAMVADTKNVAAAVAVVAHRGDAKATTTCRNPI